MKTYPKKSAENSHLPHPQRFANSQKRQWHKAYRMGQTGEQIDRKLYADANRKAQKNSLSNMKAWLEAQS